MGSESAVEIQPRGGFFLHCFVFRTPDGAHIATAQEKRPSGWRAITWYLRHIFNDPAHRLIVNDPADTTIFEIRQPPHKLFRMRRPVAVTYPNGGALGTIARASANPLVTTLQISHVSGGVVARIKQKDFGRHEVRDNADTLLANLAVNPSRLTVDFTTPVPEPLRTLLLAAPIAVRLDP